MADKVLERLVMEKFRTTFSDFPGQPIQDEDPDFLVPLSGGQLGIELTDFVEQPARHVEEIHNEVLRLASQAFVKRCSTPVLVYTDWRHGVRIDKAYTAQHLAALVHEMLPQPVPEEEQWLRADWDHLRKHSVDQVISSVTLVCSRKRTHNEWFPMEFGFAHTDPADVQQRLDKKEARLSSYRRRCNQVWLLIYFLKHRISSAAAEITPEVLGPTYTSGFDRVFLFDFYQAEIAELVIAPPHSPTGANCGPASVTEVRQ